MHNKTDLLKVVSEKTGLKINKGKTEVMKIVTTPITVVGEHVKEVESFVYLGSVVDKKGGTDQDGKRGLCSIEEDLGVNRDKYWNQTKNLQFQCQVCVAVRM